MISEHSYMSLFGQFPFWVPTSFPEAIYPTCNPHVPVIKEQIKTAKKQNKGKNDTYSLLPHPNEPHLQT